MADPRRQLPSPLLDIEQILLEAQSRWLRPAEICEILRNYDKFQIALEPPKMPPSGSLFLFDRKVLRYFRKDGHNWRKKKDGRTVKEAHERLKAGSIDVLHCYYAHGEENENFQRRSYWMLEEELSHIVLVHYREGNRKNFNRLKEAQAAISSSCRSGTMICNTKTGNLHPKNGRVPSQTTDLTTLQASEQKDTESDHLGKFSTTSILGLLLTQAHKSKSDNASGMAYELQKNQGFSAWAGVSENITVTDASMPYQPSFATETVDTARILSSFDEGNEYHYQQSAQDGLQWAADQKLQADALYYVTATRYCEQISGTDLLNSLDRHTPDNQNSNEPQLQIVSGEKIYVFGPESDINIEGKPVLLSIKGDHKFEVAFRERCLQKVESFNRWLSKEMGDVDKSHLQASVWSSTDMVSPENKVDVSSIPSDGKLNALTSNESISQDQLFSILDFSPNWAYAGCKIKVLITGKFSTSVQGAENMKFLCMFGEVEVPAELIADGVLRCQTPIHEVGRVPFYVRCSNRSACSEVREFEFRVGHSFWSKNGTSLLEILQTRLIMLLCQTPRSSSQTTNINSSKGGSQLSSKLNSLLKEDTEEWDQMVKASPEEIPLEKSRDLLLEKLIKEKLRIWLLQKVSEGGKGANLLDDGGQGVIHFSAALGYDWALEPTIVSGVNVNFRDVNGWTALHWAASQGRERTVALLVALGAAPGVLTDPVPRYPLGQTPADLASMSGHKGIAGYLAESSLSTHLSSLALEKLEKEIGSGTLQDVVDGLPLKESLAAVCNAAQAAARIYQVFRVQSFQKKALKEYRDGKFRMSEEKALSLITIKSNKAGEEPANAAAIRIQKKFRGWKGRRDFLMLRQRIVKIQALVRGHQVRKTQKKIIWCVGILEKVILRWRRKGCGLRGFKPEAHTNTPDTVSSEDDYNFLKETRKQAEVRLQKALDRVKSMIQYPEGREQYHRLLKVVDQIQKTKAFHGVVAESTEATADLDEELIDIDIEAWLNEDTFIPL